MPNLYATATDLKARLGITGTSEDARLAMALEVASRHVDRICRRTFFTRRAMVLVDSDGQAGSGLWANGERVQLLLDDLMAASEVAVDRDGDGTFAEVWTVGTDFALWPWNHLPAQGIAALASGRYALPSMATARWMRVTGVWGYGDGDGNAWAATGLSATVASATGRTLTVLPEAGAGEYDVADVSGILAGMTVQVGGEQMGVVVVTAGTPGAAEVPAEGEEPGTPEVAAVPATLTVARGLNGTTAAAHASSDVGGNALSTAVYPVLVVEAALAVATRIYSRMEGETMQSESIGDYNFRRYLPEQEVAMDKAWLEGLSR